MNRIPSALWSEPGSSMGTTHVGHHWTSWRADSFAHFHSQHKSHHFTLHQNRLYIVLLSNPPTWCHLSIERYSNVSSGQYVPRSAIVVVDHQPTLAIGNRRVSFVQWSSKLSRVEPPLVCLNTGNESNIAWEGDIKHDTLLWNHLPKRTELVHRMLRSSSIPDSIKLHLENEYCALYVIYMGQWEILSNLENVQTERADAHIWQMLSHKNKHKMQSKLWLFHSDET
jgi:hypothetical protein